MFILTIVMAVSQVIITSSYSTKYDCEMSAARVLAVNVGTQAVQSATCREAKAAL